MIQDSVASVQDVKEGSNLLKQPEIQLTTKEETSDGYGIAVKEFKNVDAIVADDTLGLIKNPDFSLKAMLPKKIPSRSVCFVKSEVPHQNHELWFIPTGGCSRAERRLVITQLRFKGRKERNMCAVINTNRHFIGCLAIKGIPKHLPIEENEICTTEDEEFTENATENQQDHEDSS
ncbi:hypothetical protein GHT06_020268 [Daphnia sinensis]|uniref:Uncharacterized protein n=1 Tax=Daphnia sinensis TaxID=1820382 RepID=A0AAD5KLV9_9CRUS|nr:hypothetical protein GHT06_020268 [Daphnia sinensis]